MSKNPNNQYAEFVGKVVGVDISKDELCTRLLPLRAEVLSHDAVTTLEYNPRRIRV